MCHTGDPYGVLCYMLAMHQCHYYYYYIGGRATPTSSQHIASEHHIGLMRLSSIS